MLLRLGSTVSECGNENTNQNAVILQEGCETKPQNNKFKVIELTEWLHELSLAITDRRSRSYIHSTNVMGALRGKDEIHDERMGDMEVRTIRRRVGRTI